MATRTNHNPPAPAAEPMGEVKVQAPLPGDLHRGLKAYAANHGMTLREVFVTALTEWLAGHS